jgi:hypothetical protein
MACCDRTEMSIESGEKVWEQQAALSLMDNKCECRMSRSFDLRITKNGRRKIPSELYSAEPRQSTATGNCFLQQI